MGKKRAFFISVVIKAQTVGSNCADKSHTQSQPTSWHMQCLYHVPHVAASLTGEGTLHGESSI